MVIKIIMLLAFFAVTIGVGLYFRKKNTSVDDFVLGGRNVGPWISAFAFGTSYFSAVIFVGYAGQFGWRFGTAATWVGLGNAFIGSLMAWFVLGRRTRVMTNHLKSATMPDFFGARYLSPALKIGASIIAFIFLIPYTASLYNGLARLFSIGFNIDFIYCIIATGILTAVYVVAGGYLATAFNSFIQGLIMIAGIIAVIAVVLSQQGGFLQAIEKLAHLPSDAGASGLAASPGIFASFFGPDPVFLLGVFILTSLGTWGLPQMVGRFYSIKSEKMITTGAIVSTIFALLIAGGSYFLGGFGRLYAASEHIAYNANGGIIFDSIIPAMIANFPVLLLGLVIVMVFAASISTLASLVMASASTLTLDFLKGNIIKKMNDKTQLVIIRLFVVVFIFVSTLIAIYTYNVSKQGGTTFIAQLMGISWGALAGSFLAPFLYGLYWKRTTKLSIWCNFIFSSTLMLVNFLITARALPPYILPVILRNPINAGAFAMLAGLVIVPVVSVLTKAPDKAAIESCFSCYEQTVNVKMRDDLGA